MKKGLQKMIIPITASAVLLGACGNDTPSSKDQTLISSKAGDVKVEDVMKEIGKDQIASNSFKVLLSKILKDKYGDKVNDDDIEKQIDSEVKKYGGKDQFESLLKQQGMTMDKYKEQRKMMEYQKALLNEKVDISDKEIKDNTKKASHILIKVKQDKNDKEGLSDKEAKKKIDEIKKQLDKNPKDFDKLAKEESMDSSKDKNGSLGYVVKGQMVKPFEKALFKLKDGEISDVVKTDYGYHIIRADQPTDFNKEKSKLKEKITQNKLQEKPEILTDAYKKLLDEYKVDYKDSDIKKAIEDNILNPEALKEQAAQGDMQGGQQNMGM
ncbi:MULTISPECIES: peptidylprolyl isomerase PrsA [Staphylococcus]|uniref:peptidylprolyl isomerase n=3 Tax=Staphylococcus chromogenes TaxID=46126 RepID=A0AAP5C1E1_STACR|nr:MULTISPECIES: peptidylprolyl isomerase [Staphylococcus]KDP13139.1 foldase protein PrsA [Staphylococcus chromogenes MU 970]MBV5138681.1 peptidylprolyl isomerase [Staphylococcus chromogenes]MBW6089835.1 peptidylprolyl isomerase [Staphylococcus chromogenes]MCD8906104.1 peptidylprolyl isomerase [Staphylococcus chromogenes]MCD9060599.1 peptidylprolyl isomerase [Staphylococcus chromogenes]